MCTCDEVSDPVRGIVSKVGLGGVRVAVVAALSVVTSVACVHEAHAERAGGDLRDFAGGDDAKGDDFGAQPVAGFVDAECRLVST